MSEELKQAAQAALEQLEFLNACYPHKTATDASDALRRALTQRPAAQTEREAFEAWWESDGPNTSSPHDAAMSGWLAGRASLPAPQQATPEQHLTVTTTPQGEAVMVSWQDDEHRILEVVWERKQATPEPVRPNLPVAGYSNARGQEEPLVYLNDVLAQQATPEPVGEPAGYTFVQPVPDKCDRIVWRGQYIHLPITRPAPGVPEADPLQGAVDWFWQAIPNLKAHDVANRLSIGCNRAARLLAAAHAKGAGHD